jgi:hypothetical protein
MDRVRCPKCGAEHDFSKLEPTFNYPDAYLEVPDAERGLRTIVGSDDCRIRDLADTHRQYFLRVVMPVPVRGEQTPCSWGVWVEVDEAAFERTGKLWDSPSQSEEPPFPAKLANAIPSYPTTVGLAGFVQLVDAKTRPTFTLSPELEHPLATEQRTGVHAERVIEWLVNQEHGS